MAPKLNKQPNRKLDEDSNRYLYNEYTEVIKKKTWGKKTHNLLIPGKAKLQGVHTELEWLWQKKINWRVLLDLNALCTAAGNVTVLSCCWKQYGDSSEKIHGVIIWQPYNIICNHRHMANTTEKKLNRYLDIDANSGIIYNSAKWKRPKCPSREGLWSEMWSICMQNIIHPEEEKTFWFCSNMMNIEYIIPNKRSWTGYITSYIFSSLLVLWIFYTMHFDHIHPLLPFPPLPDSSPIPTHPTL